MRGRTRLRVREERPAEHGQPEKARDGENQRGPRSQPDGPRRRAKEAGHAEVTPTRRATAGRTKASPGRTTAAEAGSAALPGPPPPARPAPAGTPAWRRKARVRAEGRRRRTTAGRHQRTPERPAADNRWQAQARSKAGGRSAPDNRKQARARSEAGGTPPTDTRNPALRHPRKTGGQPQAGTGAIGSRRETDKPQAGAGCAPVPARDRRRTTAGRRRSALVGFDPPAPHPRPPPLPVPLGCVLMPGPRLPRPPSATAAGPGSSPPAGRRPARRRSPPWSGRPLPPRRRP